MLALGRALGETISVVLVISQAFEIKPYVLESGTSTISSLIASSFKEATPSQLSALLTAGFVLFCMTLRRQQPGRGDRLALAAAGR